MTDICSVCDYTPEARAFFDEREVPCKEDHCPFKAAGATDQLAAAENIKFRAALEEISDLWEASTHQGSEVTVRKASEIAAQALGKTLRPIA